MATFTGVHSSPTPTAASHVIRTHWSPRGGSPGLKAEGVNIHPIHELHTSTTENHAVFGFWRVDGFTPRTANDAERLRAIAFEVFAAHDNGYPSVRENRSKGIRCRTWLFRFIKALAEDGFFSARPSTASGIAAMREYIQAESTASEILLGGDNTTYECAFATI
ncbi:hypothetical protein CYLTODRAFT_439986 [Cylindrobasidium torrendii FP15055 ss-10]|uniref:Uncharacterized protein n=1 Tax=Cylindrobasidium torrendii FP15055 ss-10 TaxID=1314674 RepID=A0A0D7BSS1_9AGAR|nr:hypothetical protein CYLTODRAFT_439986 [Cylindrobasidium torrendii FP15055 ss-10]